jgi:AraC-like DNA-binding protein
MSLHHFGYLRLIICETGPLRLTRGEGSIPEDAEEAIAVLIPRHGSVRLVQDGRGTRLESGHLAVIDLRRTFSVEQQDRVRMLFFRIPVHALHVPVTTLRSVTARALPLTGGVAAVLAPLLLSMDESACRMPATVGERLGGIVTELVAALVEEATDEADGPRRTGRHQLVARIREYIDRHLEDPGLSAERVAAAHLVSVRYLHRLFEDEGVTVGRQILRRRVEECARELARRARVSPSIAVVAARWGFRSAAHFSRSFKAVHGYSPQQWRQLAVTRAAEPPSGPVATRGAVPPARPGPSR